MKKKTKKKTKRLSNELGVWVRPYPKRHEFEENPNLMKQFSQFLKLVRGFRVIHMMQRKNDTRLYAANIEGFTTPWTSSPESVKRMVKYRLSILEGDE